MAERYAYIIEIDDKGTATLKSMTGATQQFNQAMGKTHSELREGIATLAKYAAAYIGVQQVWGFIKDSVGAARESTAAQRALGMAYGDNAGRLTEYAGRLQFKSTLEDDEIVQAMAAVRAYRLKASTVETLTQDAADYVAYMEMTGQQGANLMDIEKSLGGAMSGRAAMMSRARVITMAQAQAIDKLSGEENKLSAIHKAMTDNFGGSAELFARNEGATKALAVAYGNLKEALGGAATNGGVMNEVAALMKERIETLTSFLLSEQGQGGLKAFTLGVLTTTQALLLAAQAGSEAFQRLGKFGAAYANQVSMFISEGPASPATSQATKDLWAATKGVFNKDTSANSPILSSLIQQTMELTNQLKNAQVEEVKLVKGGGIGDFEGKGKGGDSSREKAVVDEWALWKVESKQALEGFEQAYAEAMERVNAAEKRDKPYRDMVGKMWGADDRERKRQADEMAEEWSDAFKPEIDRVSGYMASSFRMATDVLSSGLASAMVGDKVDTQALGKNLARSFIEMNLRLAMQIPMWLAIKAITAGIAADMTIATAGMNVPGAAAMGVVGAAIGSPFKFHQGGWIRAHRGLWMDEVPIIAQRGERMASKQEVANAGGPARLDRILSGKGGGGDTYVTHVYPKQGHSEEDIGRMVEKRLRTLKRRNKLSANA